MVHQLIAGSPLVQLLNLLVALGGSLLRADNRFVHFQARAGMCDCALSLLRCELRFRPQHLPHDVNISPVLGINNHIHLRLGEFYLGEYVPVHFQELIHRTEELRALLRGVGREDVERGQVLAAPGSITPHTKFTAEAYILTKEEGGRHTPFFTNYRPQFYFRTTDVTGVVSLPEGTEMVMPGDNVSMEVELIAPIAMDEGLRFAIREGGRTVGAGVVASIIE